MIMASPKFKKRRVGDLESLPGVSAFAALAASRNRQAQQSSNLMPENQGRISPSQHNHEGPRELSRTTRKPEEHRDNPGIGSEIEQPLIIPATTLQMSTIRPNRIAKCSETKVQVLLEPGNRLIVLGQYDLVVRKGHVKILGSNLHASSTKYHVDAPSSHCLPVVRCDGMEIETAEITLSRSSNGLEQLGQVSRLFRGIWSGSTSSNYENEDTAAVSEQSSLDMGSFQILYSISSSSLLRPIISPPEWNALLSTLQSSATQKTPIVLVCGPKSSGKSTFSKILINRIISSREATQSPSQKANEHGVVVLDCDPGQPEYSPPGLLSLNLLKDPNFGPPFSHPTTPGTRNHLIRAHSVVAVTPANDPELYKSCVLDLVNHYHTQYSQYSLVINTSGWILGTGLEILVDLIQAINPTAVVYMSQEGPLEVVEALQEAAKLIPLYTLPSQGNEFNVRNSANLRDMQTMSYFHLENSAKNLNWDPTPLSSIPPIQIHYTGKNAGILGILCLSYQPPPELLAELINGSVLSIVVIDDLLAIPGHNHINDLETPDLPSTITKAYNHLNHHEPSTPTSTILRTPKERIPYFNPLSSTTLDPTHSHTIGCLLLRGIDAQHGKLQVQTPVPVEIFQEIRGAGKLIVLVSGKLDNPGWAYTEEGEAFGAEMDRPYVEKLRGGEGRGEGGKVWRIRRDLGRGKSGD